MLKEKESVNNELKKIERVCRLWKIRGKRYEKTMK
jgi:hypothetical protein